MHTTQYTMASLGSYAGKEIGCSDWIAVPQSLINQFADCTGDHQWVHVDIDRAKRDSPYGGTIAHGYLTLSLVAGSVMNIGVIPTDVIAAFNYGVDKVRFIAPVKAGARVRARVELVDLADQGGGRHLMKMRNTVEIEGESKPALVAETLALLVGRA